MSISKPKFVDSPYFIMEDGNWHLAEDAPEDVKQEFEEYLEYEAKLKEMGVVL